MRAYVKRQEQTAKGTININLECEIVPVKTRILTHRDNIADAIKEYCGDSITDKDVVAVAESVVAITQGRFYDIADIKPTLPAKVLCLFFPLKGSLSTRYAMQKLMDEEGTFRVCSAFIIGTIGKLFGQRGLFYKLAGNQSRLIDDFSGTMPPYDKYIVFGPNKTKEVVNSIRDKVGAFGAVIADVNDLKKADILEASKGVVKTEISQILIDNPFGNASEKTPITIIKNYALYMQDLANQRAAETVRLENENRREKARLADEAAEAEKAKRIEAYRQAEEKKLSDSAEK